MVLKKQLNCCTGVISFYSFTLVFVCVCVGVFFNVVIHLIEINNFDPVPLIKLFQISWTGLHFSDLFVWNSL